MSGFPNQPQFPEVDFPPPTPVKKRSKTTLYVVAGCLGLLLIGGIVAIFAVSILGVGIYQGVSSVADSEAFRIAKQHVTSSATARAELGDNIEFGSFPSNFNISTDNGQSKAMFEFSATGTKGAGTVHVELVGAGDSWKVVKASLRGPSGKESTL